MTELAPIEYVYGIGDVAPYDEPYAGRQVVPFRIIRKTAKRIYYVRRYGPNGGIVKTGYVDRQKLEAAGDKGLWARRTGGWWEDDALLYISPPTIHDGRRPSPAALKAELSRLRAEMAAIHPDRGGDHEKFIAAHKRYEAAKAQFARVAP